MNDTELGMLLRDCLRLWDVDGRLTFAGEHCEIETADGVFSIAHADPDLRPVRWFLQTPERRAAGRPARALPSIVAALSALRNHLGAAAGASLRIGAH